MEDLTGKSAGGGGAAGKLAATEWNPFFQELKNMITKFVTMDVAQSDQLERSIVSIAHRSTFYTGGGTAQAQTLTTTSGIGRIYGYVNQTSVAYRPSVNNTGGAPTINVNGLGPRTVIREDGSALQAGDLSTTRDAHLRYDGTDFRLLNSSLGAPAQALPNGYRSGLTMGRSADLDHDIEVQIGSCRDVSNTYNMVLSTALTKRFDAAAAIGTGTGGFPSALTRTAGTNYRFFLVYNNATGVVEAGWDTSATATNLLNDLAALSTGFGYYRQIGWSRTQTGSSTELRHMTNLPTNPTYFSFDVAEQDNAPPGAAPTVEQTDTAKCPPNVVAKLRAFGVNGTIASSGALVGRVYPTDEPDIVVSTSNANFSSGIGPTAGTYIGEIEVPLDASSQYNHKWTSGVNVSIYFNVAGFFYEG